MEEHFINFDIDISLSDTWEFDGSEEQLKDMIADAKKEAIRIVKEAFRTQTAYDITCS